MSIIHMECTPMNGLDRNFNSVNYHILAVHGRMNMKRLRTKEVEIFKTSR